jgi:hypothetical protein
VVRRQPRRRRGAYALDKPTGSIATGPQPRRLGQSTAAVVLSRRDGGCGMRHLFVALSFAAGLALAEGCGAPPSSGQQPAVTNAPAPTATRPVSPTLTPTPVSASPTQEPRPTATRTPVVATVWVGNTDGQGVYLRSSPRDPDKVRAYPDRTPLLLIGDDIEGEGQIWRHVRAPDELQGFVPAKYTIAVEPTPIPRPPTQTPPAATATAAARPTTTGAHVEHPPTPGATTSAAAARLSRWPPVTSATTSRASLPSGTRPMGTSPNVATACSAIQAVFVAHVRGMVVSPEPCMAHKANHFSESGTCEQFLPAAAAVLGLYVVVAQVLLHTRSSLTPVLIALGVGLTLVALAHLKHH